MIDFDCKMIEVDVNTDIKMNCNLRIFYSGCRVDNASCLMINVVLKRVIGRDREEVHQESKGRQSTH